MLHVWARWNRFALLGVVVCVALNWLGDSLDGTLARFRQRLRPRYGFYVDHMVDSFGALALMGGLVLSGYMHPAIAIGLLLAFLMLSIQSYLATHALGEFRLSFWRFGPTELRILLVVGNLALLWKPRVHFAGGHYRLFDVGGAIGLAGMALMLLSLHRAEHRAALSRREDRQVMNPNQRQPNRGLPRPSRRELIDRRSNGVRCKARERPALVALQRRGRARHRGAIVVLFLLEECIPSAIICSRPGSRLRPP